MSDSEDDSILDNIQKTRQLWNTKADTSTADFLIPKSPVPAVVKSPKSPPPLIENHVNGDHESDEIIRFEDQIDEDFDLPDVKSMKSKWEKAGPVPKPQTKAPKAKYTNHVQIEPENLIPVNREVEETKEEYGVELGKLREKFEKEAKRSKIRKIRRRSYKMQNMCAKFEDGGRYTSKITLQLGQNAKVLWSDEPRSSVSKAAIDERVNMKKKHVSTTAVNKPRTTSKQSQNKRFETEIRQQHEYSSNKENTVELPKVELLSIKQQFEKRKDERVVTPYTPNRRKPRETSISSDTSGPAIEIVRYDDLPEEEVKFEIEMSSIRQKFEQNKDQSKPTVRSLSTSSVYKKTVTKQPEHTRDPSESEDVPPVEIVKSSEAKYDQMTGEESVKDRLERFKAMAEESKKSKASEKFSFQKKVIVETTVEVKKQPEEISVIEEEDIVRSPPAGTKERAEYTPSIDLEQTKLLFEQSSRASQGSSRSSRSSSGSPQRRSPRSKSTPSPVKRGSRNHSSTSSKSPSPVRQVRRNSGSSSYSSQSSGRASPQSKKTTKSVKKVGDPDVVVLEHSEINYYYDEGTRHSTKVKELDSIETEEVTMSNGEVIRPNPAGTKETPEYVPVNIGSVRSMFENPKEETQTRGRAPPPKKTIVFEREEKERESSDSTSPERNPEIVRSTAAGVREEPQYQISVDLKAARSKFESPHRPEQYVPRNTIRQREEEARQRRAAVAAASPRSSESSDASEVVKTTEAGSKETPEYRVDLKAAKQLFESGGPVPTPVKHETKVIREDVEIKGELVRPEPAGTRMVVELNTSKDIGSVKKIFEGSESQVMDEEQPKRKSPIDIQQEARMVIQKEQERKEESVTSPESERRSSDSESSQTDTEGEVVLERDSSDEGQEVIDEGRELADEGREVTSAGQVNDESVSERKESSDESEDNEEPAAAVVPVRVAIPEDQEDTKEEQINEQEPVAKQEYETYTKVIDYNEATPQQAQSTSDSESDVEQNTAEQIQDVKQDYEEKKDEDVVQQGENPQENINYENGDMNHIADSPVSDEQNYNNDLSEISQKSSHSIIQEKDEGMTTPADDNSGYLQ